MLSRRKRALCILIESIVIYGGGIAGKLYHISVVYIEIELWGKKGSDLSRPSDRILY